MIKLKEKVTGTPVFGHHPYPTKTKIKEQTQFNTLAHCRVKLAKQCIVATAKTHITVLNLFNLQSRQESHEDDDRGPPPFFPPKKCNPDARDSFSHKCLPPSYYSDKAAKKVEGSER